MICQLFLSLTDFKIIKDSIPFWIGSDTGTLSDMIELVSLARRGVIKPVVSHRFKLDQATETLTMLKDGKIIGRGVINP
jgi:alcohol dehydrogenase, propanol-preferring